MSIKKYFQLAKYTLFPICRSITGNGTLKTLKIIKKNFPNFKIIKVKSGTRVFDWKVPNEWNIKDAYIIDKYNKKIVSFKKNNLHLVGYSKPLSKILSKKKLFQHIYSLPDKPNAIPYVTSYYKKQWGFCITHRQKLKFDKKYKKSDMFKIIINSNFNSKGNLSYGELILKGKSKQEILISTYICHPSMANNELSGITVSMGLIDYFSKINNLQKTLRFIFIPETIGSITYLSKNLSYLKQNVIGGYNLSCIGDERQHSCMFSKYESSPSDESLVEAYKKLKVKYKTYSFLNRGSDERQFNSPGVDLSISSIFRSKYGEYPEYHTSLDNFNVVTLKGIKGGFEVAKTAINILLKKIIPENKILCEPQMSKRGMYPTISRNKQDITTKTYMNFLQYADGKNSLKKISRLINISENMAVKVYSRLKGEKLLK